MINTSKAKLDFELSHIQSLETDLKHTMDKQGINPKDPEHLALFLENYENKELYEKTLKNPDQELYFKEQFFRIPEYEGVHHLVASLTNKATNPAGLRAIYSAIAAELKFDKV